jgi:SAM-dependent methyltransferase
MPRRVDRKWPYRLMECRGCAVSYRFPRESSRWSLEFYQCAYDQPGLTTDLPADEELSRLMSEDFRGSSKDFARVVAALRALYLDSGARILDYGANWGYAVFQLCNAGFRAIGFETSVPRASFGTKLGVDVVTDTGVLKSGFDASYSGHVLEHTPDPLGALKVQMQLVREGGYVLGHVPNGSPERRRADPRGFHKAWGLVHPFLLSARFFRANFGGLPLFISSSADPEELRRWRGTGVHVGPLDGPELFFAIRNRRL